MYVIYMQISDIKNYNMYSSMCYFDLLTFIFQHSRSIDALSWTSMWGVSSDFCQYFLDKNAKFFWKFVQGGGSMLHLLFPLTPALWASMSWLNDSFLSCEKRILIIWNSIWWPFPNFSWIYSHKFKVKNDKLLGYWLLTELLTF